MKMGVNLVKLYEVHPGSRVRLVSDPEIPPGHPFMLRDTVVQFFRIDGMYSFCRTDKDGSIVHPAAWTLVEVL